MKVLLTPPPLIKPFVSVLNKVGLGDVNALQIYQGNNEVGLNNITARIGSEVQAHVTITDYNCILFCRIQTSAVAVSRDTATEPPGYTFNFKE